MRDIKIKLLSEDVKLPEKADIGSSGYDLRSTIDFVLLPGERFAIPTGISIELELGEEAQVRPRSGLAIKYGVTVLNSPGSVDSSFRGEIKVILINHSNECFQIKKGDRIAQLVFAKIMDTNLVVAEELNETDRGSNGLGSSGVK